MDSECSTRSSEGVGGGDPDCGEGATGVRLLAGDEMLHISIDWDPTALHLRYQTTREKIWKDHSSVALCQKQQVEPIDLDHCLKAFTTEEKLEERYHCSKCQALQPATKKLQIWRLPPVLIIHLKRFNFLNNKWVKSQKMVKFPVSDFDPTAYLASVPQETILRQKELKERHYIMEEDCLSCNEDNDCNELSSNNENNNINKCPSNVHSDPKRDRRPTRRSISSRTRERLISSSLTKTPIIDGDFEDFHQHRLAGDADIFDLKYQLYAVVSHSGMLNGGHYVSYASNPNGAWYCYNDSSCRELPSSGSPPALDTGSAYMLFYERKGLDYTPYFPDVTGRPLTRDPDADPDDAEIELKKICALS